jgi:hypothetical protein
VGDVPSLISSYFYLTNLITAARSCAAVSQRVIRPTLLQSRKSYSYPRVMGISFRQIALVHQFFSKTTLPSTILIVASTLLIAFCIHNCLFRKWRGPSVVCESEIGVFDVQMCPVTQVWPPDEYKGPIHFDVVFFHGFQFGQDAHNMWKTTWSTRNRPETCWPQEWLGPQLGNDVRILLLSYDAYATKSKSHEFGNTEDVSHIAKNLVQSVVTRFD